MYMHNEALKLEKQLFPRRIDVYHCFNMIRQITHTVFRKMLVLSTYRLKYYCRCFCEAVYVL